ncbi:MAG: glycosyltransferase family 9 protein [Chthoniobacterales bacterium]
MSADSIPHPPDQSPRPRILVIRGGAIGDFILTLPALALLRDAFPDAHVEILGTRHIIALAEGRYYADATRSIEYAPMAGFFNPKSELDPELCEYFASFGQVISYLFDPDDFFKGNLERAGVRNLLVADPRVGDQLHAAHHLAAPLQRLALFLENTAPDFFPTDEDLIAARARLPADSPTLIAVHPGSGDERKNWPVDRWSCLLARISDDHPNAHILIVGGEADTPSLDSLRATLSELPATFLVDLDLPVLGAVFSLCSAFLGHDSGVSHLAAATDCPSLLLFGPTDPAIWAPQNENVRVLTAAHGSISDISLDSAHAAAEALLQDVIRARQNA